MVKGNIILPLNKPGYQFQSTKVSSVVIHSTQTWTATKRHGVTKKEKKQR